MKSLKEMTLEDFRAVPYIQFGDLKPFSGFVIVPTGELHDSGFGCMKFVLTHRNEIIGAVGGGCDVIHLNGIGGYGLDWKKGLDTRMVPVIEWSIDLLPASGCLRIFTDHELVIRDPIICSDMEIFDGGTWRRKE